VFECIENSGIPKMIMVGNVDVCFMDSHSLEPVFQRLQT
jgi:hypothetical protein